MDLRLLSDHKMSNSRFLVHIGGNSMEYYKELRKYVGHRPIILPGSVVIIVNDIGEILLQERNDGSWGLPGGLMNLGE